MGTTGDTIKAEMDRMNRRIAELEGENYALKCRLAESSRALSEAGIQVGARDLTINQVDAENAALKATLAMVKKEAAANCGEMDYDFMGCQLNRIEKILSFTPAPIAVVEGGVYEEQVDIMNEWPWDKGHFRVYPTIVNRLSSGEIHDLLPVTVVVLPAEKETP